MRRIEPCFSCRPRGNFTNVVEEGCSVGCQDGEDAIVCTCSDQEEDGLEDGGKAVGPGVDAILNAKGAKYIE
jgi:hypothetical protein